MNDSGISPLADLPRELLPLRQPLRNLDINGENSTPVPTSAARPTIAGKFFCLDNKKWTIRGVTYGPLCSSNSGAGSEYCSQEIVRRDFELMRGSGINAIRTYTVPPKWLLDIAQESQLRVLVGVTWAQHIAFLESTADLSRLSGIVGHAVADCARHPAIFAYCLGNEIPSAVVRWHGHQRVERCLRELYLTAKDSDPDALVTYANYPSTEYLETPFLDFLSFNVYLESTESFSRYLSRLQIIAGDRPLVMSETGLDSRRHGTHKQAEALRDQVCSAYRGGCAGLFVFSWTDQWHRGGEDIVDWEFGLTTRNREPKPSLDAVADAFADAPMTIDRSWPAISVIICTYNGSSTLRWCLEGACQLRYPEFEIVVVDDGSSDQSAQIAREFGQKVRLIQTANQGLSSARNEGIRAARHEIVAFLDDDARPDADWLTFLADAFQRTDHAGIGGPNIPPVDEGSVARAVALAPGGPVHVLLTDEVAEHIPGCNMAFRKSRLVEIGGFDPQFRIAGDDVDMCWRLQARNYSLGFNPAAMVWHRRRATVRGYLRQQYNYGRAEADLERKWPEKYNVAGHLTWAGRLYRGNGLLQAINWWAKRRIYHGTWGSAMFQSVYHAPPNWILSVPAMPEWYLLVCFLGALGGLGRFWTPLYAALPLCILAAAAPGWQAVHAARAAIAAHPFCGSRRYRFWAMVTLLNILQPAVRLLGRLRRGLTPWRARNIQGLVFRPSITFVSWSDIASNWTSQQDRLKAFESGLISKGAVVVSGGNFDRWDMEIRGGAFGGARTRFLVEEHGQGKQCVRLRLWPSMAQRTMALCLSLLAIALIAAVDRAFVAALFFACIAIVMVFRALIESARAMSAAASTAHDQSYYEFGSENLG